MGDWRQLRSRWDSLPPRSHFIDCSGLRHEVAISRGELEVLSHVLEDERALVALGGRMPECLQLEEDWRMQARTNLWALLGDSDELNPFREKLIVETQLFQRSPKQVIDRSGRLTGLPMELRHILVADRTLSRFSKSATGVRDYVADAILEMLDGQLSLNERQVARLRFIDSFLWHWVDEVDWELRDVRTLALRFESGRLQQLPPEPEELHLVLRGLAETLSLETQYTRAELELLLSAWCPEPRTARESLVAANLLTRSGGRYKRSGLPDL